MGETWASYRLSFWLSDHELLFLRHLSRNEKGDYDLCRFDLRTRREEALQQLTHRFNQKRGLRWEQSLSPDKQWLLWTDGEDKQQTATVASLTGQQSFSWSLSNVSDPIF